MEKRPAAPAEVSAPGPARSTPSAPRGPGDGGGGAWSERIGDDEKLLGDCDVEYLRASGPGGQHRNKVESGVRLTHLPTGVVANATERRSQSQNREVALERLREKLAALLKPRRPRRPTRKPRAVRRREVDDKRRRGAAKRQRGGKSED